MFPCVSELTHGFLPSYPRVSLVCAETTLRGTLVIALIPWRSDNPEIPTNTDGNFKRTLCLILISFSSASSQWEAMNVLFAFKSGEGEVVRETHSKNSVSHVWHNVRAWKWKHWWLFFFFLPLTWGGKEALKQALKSPCKEASKRRTWWPQ